MDYNCTWMEELRTDEGVRWASDMGFFNVRAGYMVLNPGNSHSATLEAGWQAWWMNYKDPYWWVHTEPRYGGPYLKFMKPLGDAKFSIDAGYMRGYVNGKHHETGAVIPQEVNHLWQITGEFHFPLWEF